MKLGRYSSTHSAHPPYKGTEKNPHFQIKTVTMCPIRAICIIVKEFPDALITLQCGVFWQYDIMSELTNVDNSYTNVNNVWKNAPDKIFLYGKKGVVASPLIQ